MHGRFRYSAPSRRTLALLLAAMTACYEAPPAKSSPLERADPSRSVAESTFVPAGSLRSESDVWSGPRPRRPRVPMAVSLKPLMRIGAPGAVAAIESPVDLRFSQLGLLVSDHGSLDVRIYNSSSGALERRVGRYGRGPWEFVVPPTIIGTYENPLLLEASIGRIHEFSKLASFGTTTMNRARQWITGCRLPDGNLLTQAAAAPVGMAFYRSEIGGDARLLDSAQHPIVSVRSHGFFVQQTAVRQVDDSTCGYFPAYHSVWALEEASGAVRVAFAVESLPPASMITEPTERGARFYVSADARAGHLDTRSWRDFVVILFQGTSRDRNKLLDFYDRRSLSYVGSVVLPHPATRIAFRGDTLAVIEEVDDEPRVQLYLLLSAG